MDENRKPESRPFVERTTMHGLLDIAEATSTTAKISWFIVILLAFVASVVEIYKTVQDYIESPIMTTFSTETVDQMYMPQVYICPMSPVDSTKSLQLDHYEYINKFLNGPNSSGMSTVLSNKRRNSDFMIQALEVKIKNRNLCLCLKEPLTAGSGDNNTENSTSGCKCDADTETTTAFNPLNPMDTPDNIWHLIGDNVGFSVDQVLVECAFRNFEKNCTTVSETYFDVNYGRCILLSINETQISPGKGWTLLIDAKGNRKIGSLMKGVSVTLLEEYNPVDAANNKFYISSGTYSKVSIAATKFHQISINTVRMQQTCIENEKRSSKFDFVSLPYNIGSCKLDCAQNEAYESYGCLLPFDQRTVQEEHWQNVCNYTKYLDILSNMGGNKTYEAKSKNCSKHCFSLCDIWKYDYAVTSAVIEDSFAETLPVNTNASNSATERFRNKPSDFIVLDIAFAELQFNKITQSESMTIDTMIGNIGGQYGLWLGGSILSIVQIVGALISCVYGKVRRREKQLNQIADEQKTA